MQIIWHADYFTHYSSIFDHLIKHMLPLETKIPFIHHILFSVGLQIRKILMWKYIFLSAMRERKKHTVYALTLTDFKVIKPRNQFQVTTECNNNFIKHFLFSIKASILFDPFSCHNPWLDYFGLKTFELLLFLKVEVEVWFKDQYDYVNCLILHFKVKVSNGTSMLHLISH